MADWPLAAGVLCLPGAMGVAAIAAVTSADSGVVVSCSNTESEPTSEQTSLGAVFFFFFFGRESHVWAFLALLALAFLAFSLAASPVVG